MIAWLQTFIAKSPCNWHSPHNLLQLKHKFGHEIIITEMGSGQPHVWPMLDKLLGESLLLDVITTIYDGVMCFVQRGIYSK